MPCHANKTVTNCVLAMYGTCFYNTVFDHCIFHFMQTFFLHKEQGTMLILDLTSQRLPYLTYLVLQGWQRPYKLVCFVYYSVGQVNMSRLRLIEAIHVMEIP